MEWLNNRDVSILIWSAILCVIALRSSEVRESLTLIVKAIFERRILTVFSFVVVYCVGVSWLAWELNVLNSKLIKVPIIWLFWTGFSIVMKVNEIGSGKVSLGGLVLSHLKGIVFISLLLKLTTFSLPVELLLVPFVSLLVLMKVYSEAYEYRQEIVPFLDKLLTLILFLGLCFVCLEVYRNPQVVGIMFWVKFLLPFIYSALFIPIIYVIVVYSQMEMLFDRIERVLMGGNEELSGYFKRLAVMKYWYRVEEIKYLNKVMFLSSYTTKSDVDRVFSQALGKSTLAKSSK